MSLKTDFAGLPHPWSRAPLALMVAFLLAGGSILNVNFGLGFPAKIAVVVIILLAEIGMRSFREAARGSGRPD